MVCCGAGRRVLSCAPRLVSTQVSSRSRGLQPHQVDQASLERPNAGLSRLGSSQRDLSFSGSCLAPAAMAASVFLGYDCFHGIGGEGAMCRLMVLLLGLCALGWGTSAAVAERR